jgi:hypothetical protein
MFAFVGLRGQRIFVDPASRLVMIHTAVVRNDTPRNPADMEEVALWQGLVRQLGTEQRSMK